MKLTIDLTAYQGETMALALQRAKTELVIARELALRANEDASIFEQRASALDAICQKMYEAIGVATSIQAAPKYVSQFGLN